MTRKYYAKKGFDGGPILFVQFTEDGEKFTTIEPFTNILQIKPDVGEWVTQTPDVEITKQEFADWLMDYYVTRLGHLKGELGKIMKLLEQ